MFQGFSKDLILSAATAISAYYLEQNNHLILSAATASVLLRSE